jgi:thymidylate synthase
MKSVFVQEKNLDSMWFRLLSEVYQHGRKNHIDTGSFEGSNRLEFDWVSGTIEFPTTRPLAPIMPEGVPPVTTDEEIEKYFWNYLMNGELSGNEHYKYATWIAGGSYQLPYIDIENLTANIPWKTTLCVVNVPNQVQWIIDHYKEKGFGNNHCYIQVGYPESNIAYNLPYKNEAERKTSPCLRGIDTHIKDGTLHMAVYFRSWDLYAGFPENMGGITMLGEYIANELDIKMGPLSFASLKLHCYDFQIELVKTRLNIKE